MNWLYRHGSATVKHGIKVKRIGGNMTLEDKWNYLIDGNILTEDALSLVVKILGYNDETMSAVLYAITGYNSFEQLEKEG